MKPSIVVAWRLGYLLLVLDSEEDNKAVANDGLKVGEEANC